MILYFRFKSIKIKHVTRDICRDSANCEASCDIKKMEPQDKDRLFDRVLLEHELSDGYFLDEYLESFILRQFREERYRDRVLDFLDSQIERAQPDTYGKSAALRQKIVFLNEIGTGF